MGEAARRWRAWGPRAAPILTLGLLAAIHGHGSLSRPRPEAVEDYHRRVAAAAGRIPCEIGEWAGSEATGLLETHSLLKPNAAICRRYVHRQSGREALLIAVQCRDARDMVPQYPPVFYPGRGWKQVAAAHRDWQAAGRFLEGTEYVFSEGASGHWPRLVVESFLLAPGGRGQRDMEALWEAARRYPWDVLGAAQIQVAVDAVVPEEERREITRTLVGTCAEFISVACSGDSSGVGDP